MKTEITGLSLLAFLVSYNLYLYSVANYICDIRVMKLWNYYSIGELILSIFISECMNIDNYFQAMFVNVSKIILLLTIVVIILTNHGIIKTPYYSLSIIDLGTAIATGSIIFSGYRHGYFKDE